MARSIISRPFFVFVLSVPTLLLLWQDASAQGTDTQIPTSMSALNGLSLSAGKYSGWVTACDDSATIKQDFMAAADSLDPKDKTHVVDSFNNWHSSVFSRTNRSLEVMRNSNPNPRSSGAATRDPCTDETRNEYREQYEIDLLSAQKLAANERAAAARTSAAASSQEPSATPWSLPALPGNHASKAGLFQRRYVGCVLKANEEICQCRMDATVDDLKKNPTHTLNAVMARHLSMPCER